MGAAGVGAAQLIDLLPRDPEAGGHGAGDGLGVATSADLTAEFLDRRGHWRESVETQHVALAAARRLGDLPAQADLHRVLARAYTRLGDHDEAHVHGWRLVTDAVHRAGGRIALQLWHVGRISHSSFHAGALPVAPSAVKPAGQSWTPAGQQPFETPHALTPDEIHEITVTA